MIVREITQFSSSNKIEKLEEDISLIEGVIKSCGYADKKELTDLLSIKKDLKLELFKYKIS